jgi:hypothetical protein
MDRGQPERPADGSDDTIEAIEAVVAPADDDVSDAPSEGGSSMEAPPPAFAPDGRPPAHWLAYIRTRAPGLLGPDGGLAGQGRRPAPDVVPHGPAAHAAPWSPADGGPPPRPAAHVAPWPPADGGAPPRPAADRAAMRDADAPSARADDQTDPWAAENRRSPRPGPAPGTDRPAEPPASARLQGGAGLPPLPGTPPIHHDDVTFGAEALAGEGRDEWRADSEHLSHEPGPPDEGRLHAPDPDASPGADVTPAPGPALSGHSTPDRLDAQMPALPRPEGPLYQRPAGSWPSFAAEPHGPRDIDASRPSAEVSPSRATPTDPTAREPEPTARPTAGSPWPTFPPLPVRSTPGPTARDAPRQDGWRVRAIAPETWRVARLDLPPWPDLPETMPEADEPDWRSIERCLQRAARLDREQRRR